MLATAYAAILERHLESIAPRDLALWSLRGLAALHAAELIEKFPVPGKGPRGIDLSPDGSRLAVAVSR